MVLTFIYGSLKNKIIKNEFPKMFKIARNYDFKILSSFKITLMKIPTSKIRKINVNGSREAVC